MTIPLRHTFIAFFAMFCVVVLVIEFQEGDKKTLKIGGHYQLPMEHDNSTFDSVKGSMAWMAPECLLYERPSKSSDVWR